MSVRRNRRSTLVLLLLIALCAGGFAVCYSAEAEPFLDAEPALETPSTERPTPFYEDVAATVPEADAEARAERSPLSRVKIFPKPAKTTPRHVTEDPQAAPEKAVTPEKTPLPKTLESESSALGEALSPLPAKSRTSYGPSLVWAMGILAAGVIIRQFLKSGGPLSNSAPSVVEVLSRQSLGPQQQMSVVRFGQRILLVGTTSTGMTTLAEVEDPDEVQSLLAELQSSSEHGEANSLLRFRRAKRPAPQSRSDRSRWAEADRTSPAVSVSLSTESRTAAHEYRASSPPNHEVNDG